MNGVGRLKSITTKKTNEIKKKKKWKNSTLHKRGERERRTSYTREEIDTERCFVLIIKFPLEYLCVRRCDGRGGGILFHCSSNEFSH